MSCSTTSLLAGTITTNTLTIEDPYIFTETVPTTPPTLFSNSQKLRSRFETKPQQQLIQQQQQQGLNTGLVATTTATNTLKESFYVKARNYGSQTQTPSLLASAAAAGIFATKSAKALTPQLVSSPTPVLGVLNTNNLKKYETKTPKLLQQATAPPTQRLQKQIAYAAQNENIIEKQQKQMQQQQKTLSATPPPLLLSHTPSLWQTPLILESNNGIATPTVIKQQQLKPANKLQQLQQQPQLSVVAAPINNTTVAATTLMISTALPLPPSNFHHTTLAQHLQKLQCLKKPKKTNAKSIVNVNPAAGTFVQPALPPPPPPILTDAPKQTTPANQQQHSAADLNEVIPVNVIYRAATTPTAVTTQNVTSPTATSMVEVNGRKPSLVTACTKIQPNQQPTKQRKPKKPKVAAVVTSNTAPNTNCSKPTTKKRRANVPLPHAKVQKRFRKTNFLPSLLNEKAAAVPDISLSTKAVAIVKRPYKDFEKETADENDELPFCVQRHWFNVQDYPPLISKSFSREERLVEYKSALRRQAMQLLATRSLQRLPYHAARKRLICVDTLLLKYRNHNRNNNRSPSKPCEVESCKNAALAMATICQQHMANNSKQNLFVICSAKIMKNNSAQPTTCNNPVLNIQKQYAPPLCYLHFSQQQQQQPSNIYASKAYESQSNAIKQTMQQTTRKRKFSAVSAVQTANNVNVGDMPQLVSRTQMQRKNSTTSLESIASNSQSSFGSVGIKPTTTAGGAASFASTPSLNMLSPPALAPLSYNTTIQKQNILPQQSLSKPTSMIDPFAEQEINKLVAQFAMAAAAKSAPPATTNNNNNNFNSFNFMNTNSNSNLTSSGVGSSSSLPSTDELLTQDMLSNCENSSAYASSSEDTGLGELSESELMAVSSIAETIEANAIAASVGGGIGGGGFNDDDVGPDEIPLGDARLLEENDLVNVFGTLPVNLNELFNAVVQQDEREEVERALEIADKHLRSLQQTIISDDFLDDILNVNDDMLVDAGDLPSNDNLEVSTLYLENADKVLNNSGVGGGGGMSSNNNLHPLTSTNITMPSSCAVGNNGANNASVMDIRGLLQT